MTILEQIQLSVVIPVYQSEDSIEILCNRINDSLSAIKINYEIILVNDGSTDDSWPIIESLAKQKIQIHGINLSRNFGQHYAIAAGLEYVRGAWVVVMDCDLQDAPEDIPNLYKKAMEGWDMVIGLRVSRQDSYFKKISSRLFYTIFSYLTNTKIDNRIGNFGIYSEKVIKSIKKLNEQNRSFGLFVQWVGYNKTYIEVKHELRTFGESSYTFIKLLSLATDSIVAHSNLLLINTVKLGILIAVFSFLIAFWLVIRFFIWNIPINGWTSVMVSIYLSTGLIIGSIGITGLYIGKIFDQVKNRPLYIISNTTFDNEL